MLAVLLSLQIQDVSGYEVSTAGDAACSIVSKPIILLTT